MAACLVLDFVYTVTNAGSPKCQRGGPRADAWAVIRRNKIRYRTYEMDYLGTSYSALWAGNPAPPRLMQPA
jgi:hypothetical protein